MGKAADGGLDQRRRAACARQGCDADGSGGEVERCRCGAGMILCGGVRVWCGVVHRETMPVLLICGRAWHVWCVVLGLLWHTRVRCVAVSVV